MKLGIECVYYSKPEVKDSYSIDQQIRELAHQIELLVEEKKKSGTNEGYKIEFQRPLSLFSLFTKDQYLRCLISNTRQSDPLPSKISQEFEREKRQSSSIDLIKFDMFNRKVSLYDIIKSYLYTRELKFLVMHFFETELYVNMPFMIKQNFLSLLNLFMPNDIIPEYITDPLIYLFLGQLLLVLRISSISLFNCGYPEQTPSLSIPSEVADLAELCLDEIRNPIHISSFDYMQLSLLLKYYRLYSPESVTMVDDMVSLDINRIIRMTYMSDYNAVNSIRLNEEQKNRISNSKGFIWAKLIDLDYTKFLIDGTPLSLTEEFYSSKFPNLNELKVEPTDPSSILTVLRNRQELFDLIRPFSDLLNNVQNRPTISAIEAHLELLLSHMKTNNLDSILAKDSSTLDSRSLKSVQFSNLIDICSLIFMVSVHLLLTPDVDSSAKIRMSKRVMESLSIMLKLSYFLDSNRHPQYNVHEQFGYSFHLIPKIFQAQHRAFQFQLSLLIRSHYHTPNIFDSSELSLNPLKAISTSNIKVLLANFRRNSKFSIYCKRLHMMHKFMILKNFGITFERISSIKFQSLLESEIEEPNSERVQIHNIFQRSLIQLIGDEEVLVSNTITQPQVDELENFLTENGLDSSTIDQLENFLEKQTFLI